MDRLGRSLRDLPDLVSSFREKGVEFVSLKGGIDTGTETDRFTFNIFASLAEFEREIITERTMAGLEAARSRGRMGGRPAALSTDALATAGNAKILYDSGERSVQEFEEGLEISRATCYRYFDIFREMEKNKSTKDGAK